MKNTSKKNITNTICDNTNLKTLDNITKSSEQIQLKLKNLNKVDNALENKTKQQQVAISSSPKSISNPFEKKHNSDTNNITKININNSKPITSLDAPVYDFKWDNYLVKIKGYEKAKTGCRPSGLVVSYGANTYQGLYR